MVFCHYTEANPAPPSLTEDFRGILSLLSGLMPT